MIWPGLGFWAAREAASAATISATNPRTKQAARRIRPRPESVNLNDTTGSSIVGHHAPAHCISHRGTALSPGSRCAILVTPREWRTRGGRREPMFSRAEDGHRWRLVSSPSTAEAGPAHQQAAPSFTVASPGGAIVVTVATDGQLTWAVTLRGREILPPLAHRADARTAAASWATNPAVTGSSTRQVDQVAAPRRARQARRGARPLQRAPHRLRRRLLAHRPRLRRRRGVPVRDEAAGRDHGRRARTRRSRSPATTRCYFPEETSFLSHQERQYKRLKISEITAGRFSSLPAHRRDPGRRRRSPSPRRTCFDYPGMDLTGGRRAEQPEGPVPRVPDEGRAGARPRREGRRARGLHREDPRHARVPVARARRRRARRRPARHRHRLPAGVRDDA